MKEKDSINNDLMALDPDFNLEQESFRARILDAVMDGADEETIRTMLDDYEEQYGQDLFWKMTTFDQAEVSHDVEEMKQMYELMENEDVSTTMRHICGARIRYCQNDFEGALEELAQVENLEDNEESLIYLHLKGLICYGLKRFDQAASCLEDIMLDVDDDQVAGITGICYLHLGKIERAREYLEQMEAKNSEGSYGWLYELLTSFDDIEIIQNPAFPESARKEIQEMIHEDFGLSIMQMEDIVNQAPDAFLPVLLGMVKEGMDDEEAIYYLIGTCYSHLGDDKEARKWYRKALRTPLPDHTLEKEAERSAIEIRLLSLSLLEYSKPVQMRYCREFLHYPNVSQSDLCDLILYGALNHLNALVAEILSEKGRPHPDNSIDARKLHHALMYYYYSNGKLYEALSEARIMYQKGLLIDVLSILMTAYLFWVFGEPRPDASTKAEDYDSLEHYLIDQLITLEQMRLDNNASGFRRKIRRMYEERKNQSDPEWGMLDDFSRTILNDLEENPSMRPAGREMRRLMEECQS